MDFQSNVFNGNAVIGQNKSIVIEKKNLKNKTKTGQVRADDHD